MYKRQCIDHVLSINKSTIEVQKGNFSTWQLNKEMRDNFEIDKNEKLKKDIARLKRAAGRMAGWSDDIEETKIGFGPCDRGNIGAKAAKMMRHAKAVETRRERAVEEKEKLLKDIEYFSPLKVNPMPYFSDTLLSLKGVGISYGGRMACRDVSFTIRQGDRIALCGKNGCGKSSVLKLILGENLEFEGEVNIGSRLKISYVRQDTSKLSGSLTAFAKSRGIDESLFKTCLLYTSAMEAVLTPGCTLILLSNFISSSITTIISWRLSYIRPSGVTAPGRSWSFSFNSPSSAKLSLEQSSCLLISAV